MALLLTASGYPEETLAARASADVVLVREDEVVAEDLYAGGNTVTIEGTIEGDLVVWAFDRLEVSGTVEGDIIGFASAAIITGTVGGSVRLVGFDLDLAGETENDQMAIAWDVSTTGTVGRDVLAWARRLTVTGEVGRDVEGQILGRARLGGRVGRDFEMTVGRLEIGPDARVEQDLIYQAGDDASIDPAATVGGVVIRRQPVPNVRVEAARLVALLLGLMALLWIGMLMIWLLPRTMQAATDSVSVRPLRSLMVGLASILLSVLLTSSILALALVSPPELALTALVVGAPIWLSLVLVLLLGLAVAPVPVAIALGRRLLGPRRSAFAGYVVGMVLFLAGWLVPYLGPVLVGVVAIVGLGALARGALISRGSLKWTVGEPSPGAHRGGRSRRLAELDDEGDAWLEPKPEPGFVPQVIPGEGSDQPSVDGDATQPVGESSGEPPSESAARAAPVEEPDDDHDTPSGD